MALLFKTAQAGLILIFFLAFLGAEAAAAEKNDMAIDVKKEGDLVMVNASLLVPVTPRQAWDVLTDYDAMTQFLPKVHTSKIIERTENRLRVAQAGTIGYGVLSVAFDYIREIELFPYREIKSTITGGSVKKGNVATRLLAEGEATRIIYVSEAVPDIWIPLGIGEAFIRNHVYTQLDSMRTEMLRRKQLKN